MVQFMGRSRNFRKEKLEPAILKRGRGQWREKKVSVLQMFFQCFSYKIYVSKIAHERGVWNIKERANQNSPMLTNDDH